MKKSLVFIGCMFVLIFISSSITFAQNEFEMEIKTTQPPLYERGGTGTIGSALSNIASFVSLNGFANTGFYWDGKDNMHFDQSEVNLLVTANINENLSTEFNMEFRNNGEAFEMEYAFADYKFSELAILRIGKFLLPTGDYNEYIEIPYIHKLASDPLSALVSPSEWTDVGLQLRGKFNRKGSIAQPYYALAITNGLQGELSFEEEEEEELEGIGDNNKNKAITAQIGVEFLKNFNTSVSYYQCMYDSTAQLGAKVAGISASYDNDKFAVYGEFHNSWFDESEIDEDTGEEEIEMESSNGFYVLGAYKIKKIEPAIRYDYASLSSEDTSDNDMSSVTLGLNYYFLRTGLVKLNYRKLFSGSEDQDFYSASLVFTF